MADDALNTLWLLHGVNLDMLGSRAPEHYGTLTLDELESRVTAHAARRGFVVRCFQTNHEGAMVEQLHELARGGAAAVIINPGAWTHYSYAIRDALELVTVPIAEVHLSDIEAREEWRRRSVIADLASVRVCGPGSGRVLRGGRRPGRGRFVKTRLAAARGVLERLRLDGVIVSNAHDVRYLSGFRGEDATLLVGRATALICTDSRYWAQVAEEVRGFTLERTDELLRDTAAAAARELGERAALGFQGGTLSHADFRLLRRRHGGRLRDVGERLSRLRGVKEAREIEAVRRAAAMTDAALEAVVAEGLVGRTEAEVAWQIREELHRRGAEGPSFDPVVAAGPRAALAHAIPGERRIVSGELVVVDCGARVDGYCSDITRTFAAGAVREELRRIYAIVLEAQLAALAALRPGVTGHDADAVARARHRGRRLRRRLRARHRPRRGSGDPRVPTPRPAQSRHGWRRAWSSRWSRVSTCRTWAGCASRTRSSSPKTAVGS